MPPLFENADYISWFPNLIRFNNTTSLGIPSYYVQSVLGKNRGKDVVSSDVETQTLYRDSQGLPGIVSAKGGLQFKDTRINGQEAALSHMLQGHAEKQGDVYTASSDPSRPVLERQGFELHHLRTAFTFGPDPVRTGTFEITAKSGPDNPISIALWCHRPFSVFKIDETAPETFDLPTAHYCLWTVDGAKSSVIDMRRYRTRALAGDIPLKVNLGDFNTYKVVMRTDGFDCYLNGALVQSAKLPSYPAISSVVTTDDRTVFVKIVNMTARENMVELFLDCDVESDYEVDILTGEGPDATNTFENPAAVSAVTKSLTGAGARFTYSALPYSLNILRLIKKQVHMV
uniref:Glycoside hydrolase family 51 protein n=1 Tax=termite gut metagenome TaxID=433724 RepID=S0DDZ1_9ZZZZ